MCAAQGVIFAAFKIELHEAQIIAAHLFDHIVDGRLPDLMVLDTRLSRFRDIGLLLASAVAVSCRNKHEFSFTF